ncbi:MAG: mechanosensitive ion channel [Anaerolineae bacterium]
METLRSLLSWLAQSENVWLSKLVWTAILVALIIGVRWLSLVLIGRRIEDTVVHYRWQKASTYIAAIAILLLVGPLWLVNARPLLTYLGLLSAGIAIALQDPMSNLAGWLFIVWRQPFRLGDRIQIGDYAGDVVDIRIFQFSLLEIGQWVDADQSTGRILHIPNRRVFSDVLANYSQGLTYIWNEIPVLVTFESNWEKAKQILTEIAQRHAGDLSKSAQERIRRASRRYMIRYMALTPKVYTRVDASGVRLTIRYLCEPRERRSTEEAIWEDVLRAFAQHPDIELAYPTQRFYARWREKGDAGDTTASAEM